MVSSHGYVPLNNITYMDASPFVSLYQYVCCLFGSELITILLWLHKRIGTLNPAPTCSDLNWSARSLSFWSNIPLLHRSSVYRVRQWPSDVPFVCWSLYTVHGAVRFVIAICLIVVPTSTFPAELLSWADLSAPVWSVSNFMAPKTSTDFRQNFYICYC